MTETRATYATTDTPGTEPTLEAQLEQAEKRIRELEQERKGLIGLLNDITDVVCKAWRPMLTYVDPVQAITVIVRERDEGWRRAGELESRLSTLERETAERLADETGVEIALRAQLAGSQRALSKALDELRSYNGHGQVEAEVLAGGFRETA